MREMSNEERKALGHEIARTNYEAAFGAVDAGDCTDLEKALERFAVNCLDTAYDQYGYDSIEHKAAGEKFAEMEREMVIPEWFRRYYPEVKHPMEKGGER